jgi:hypothetical protein
MPRRHKSVDRCISYQTQEIPTRAERQAEVERILGLRAGDLSPERVAWRAKVQDERMLRSLLDCYRATGVIDSPSNNRTGGRHLEG